MASARSSTWDGIICLARLALYLAVFMGAMVVWPMIIGGAVVMLARFAMSFA